MRNQLLGVLTAFGFLLFAIGLVVVTSLPSPTRLQKLPYPASTLIFDRHGRLLYEFYQEKNRIPVRLDELPPHLIWATIAAEDKNFYRHHGFDLRGITRALYSIVFRRRLQGGSTITQQLVKNALLTPHRTLSRKIKEAILTAAVELLYSKDQILQMYFNYIPYGGTAWGVEAAAQTYFGKSAKELSLAEAALLAGLPAAPSRFSPFGRPDAALKRRNWVLDQMVKIGKLKKEEAQLAKKQPLGVRPPKKTIKAPHFVFYVRDQLEKLLGKEVVKRGGLRVTTTLDLTLQEFAQKTVAEEIAKLAWARVSNGAALITNPKTGEILAMVGSKDYFASDIEGKFNVTTALRQPGSAIKPINYAVGLLLGKITPATVFADIPTCFSGGPRLYCPTNYDGLFHGAVQVRFALGNSFNIPAVRMLALNGLESFIATASAMGITTFQDPSRYGLSLTLGGGEVRMTDLAVAFGVFANLGIRQDLVSILKVEDAAGRVLYRHQTKPGRRVLPMGVAWLITHILLDNNARSAAFGPRSWLVVAGHPEVAVKTGTTNDKRDNWTIGYTPSVLVAVWVGNNDNSPMSAVASGVTGASPIWNKIISFALKDKKPEWPPRPADVVGATICSESGLLPPPEGCAARYEYFLAGTVPKEVQQLKKMILVEEATDCPIQPAEKKEGVTWREHKVVVDPLGTVYCFDCPPSCYDQSRPVIIRR